MLPRRAGASAGRHPEREHAPSGGPGPGGRPRPGRVDVRGQVGASRAIQAALRAATGRSPTALAAVLAAVIAEGDPLRDLHPLFDLPDDPAGTSMAGVAAFPGAVAAVLVVRVGGGARSSRCRCLAGSTHGGPV